MDDIQPVHAAAYIGAAGKILDATVEQHLACIGMLFDWLVIGQNPASAEATVLLESIATPMKWARLSQVTSAVFTRRT